MKKAKLNKYILTGSIHTVAIKSQGAVDNVQKEIEHCITASVRPGQGKSGATTTSIINPNKLVGNLYSYDECMTAINTILSGAGIDDYQIIRTDLRLDSADPEHYREFAKLNRYLISALAVTYHVRNAYRATNLFSQKQLSVAIKNKYFEAENYDKAAESHGSSQAASRLEIRSKAFKQDLRKEFTEHWSDRWEKAVKNLDQAQGAYNDALEDLYREGLVADSVRFRSMTDFLIQYQDCIFCKKQLVEFLSRFPDRIKNPVMFATNFKKRYRIEYFSDSDVRYAVDEIKRATWEFFRE